MTIPSLRHPVAVIQPLPGIGDMVWHLPHIRAIADHAGAPVTVLTKPRSLADQLLANEPFVSRVVWLDINPGGRRGEHDGIAGFFRLVRLLRGLRFGSVIMLHHSETIAAAAWLGGIPVRLGYGWGRQRLFLNAGPFLPRETADLHQHARATHFMTAARIALSDAEPHLTVLPDSRGAAKRRLSIDGTAFLALGIGSSDAVMRQWGIPRFIELAAALLHAGWPALVLVGGAGDAEAANEIRDALGDQAFRVRQALGWDLRDVAGLLAEADFYVGNNTGVMNMAAAVGIRTYALFGTTTPFEHASQIVPVTAPATGVHDGTLRVTVASVLGTIRDDRGGLAPSGLERDRSD